VKSIYLILDMQNDLVNAEGPAGRSPLGGQVAARQVIARSAAVLAKARALSIDVGFIRVGLSPDYRECPPNSQVFSGAPKAGLFKLGSWGTEIHPALEQRPSDLQVVKHRVSPFFGTHLELQLRLMGVRRIYCSGVSTQAVVQATVRDAHDRDFDVHVIEDCCAAHSEDEHRNSIQSIVRFCQVTNLDGVSFA
jgi:nicotinamidase-related amidase